VRTTGVRSFFAFLTLATCACSSRMDLQAIRYPSAPELVPKATGCDVVLLSEDGAMSERCEAIGDVFVGDTGWSFDCGRDRVIDPNRAAGGREPLQGKRQRPVDRPC
jgi:hypothetical protein